MTDMLIRDVPDYVTAALEAHARRLGLSCADYIRRLLARDAAVSDFPVRREDLARFAATFDDLTHSDVMSRAWSDRLTESTSLPSSAEIRRPST